MIALWMLYATAVGAVIGIAALLVDRIVGAVIRRRRWIWVSAIVLSVAIPLAAVFSSRDRADDRSTSVVRQPQPSPDGATETSAIAGRILDLLGKADTRALGRFDRPFAIGWGIAAVLAFAAYGIATLALARRRRTWRSALVDGEAVLLAPAVGPAVIGAVRPAIVVPEWSLDLSPEQRTLMLEHERQHVRAHDPLLLHAAAMIAMIAPWNVAFWWLNRRLRLAVELDCDARVLASGSDIRAYGTLLLDVCSRRQRPSTVLAPALLERTSSLTRRILAMQPARVRYAWPKATLGAAIALAITALACDMPTPEMVAPDGTNAPPTRVFGKLGAVAPLDGIENIKRVVGEYFPSVARGEGEPAILFVVRSSTGAIVLTEAQPASKLARTRQPRAASGEPRTLSTASPGGSAAAAPLRARVPAGSAGRTGSAALPRRVGALVPDDIEAVEVSKHAAGVVAPKPVSVVVITLKPGAPIPRLVAGQ